MDMEEKVVSDSKFDFVLCCVLDHISSMIDDPDDFDVSVLDGVLVVMIMDDPLCEGGVTIRVL